MSWWLWGLLVGGLMIGLMLRRRLLARPTSRTPSSENPHRCCERQSFQAVADFEHAAGVDLDLGRCASCGTWLMAVFWATSTTYNVISEEQAEHFLELQGTPELRRALRAWVD